jgi:hypothetical protein
MGFNIEEVSRNFPAYLSSPDKGRLRTALSDFASEGISLEDSQKVYAHFYLRSSPNYLLQADVIDSIRRPAWVSDRTSPAFATYEKEYIRAMMISNTCDVDVTDKKRVIPKEVTFIPIVPLGDYIEDIRKDHRILPNVEQIAGDIRNQQYTNLFYLPSGIGFEEHIALLDQPFWYPSDELTELIEGIMLNRVVSLSQWAYYLFVLKLTHHLCRLPEKRDRPDLQG